MIYSKVIKIDLIIKYVNIVLLMTEFCMFKRDYPPAKEFVNFIFTKRDDNMLYCKLLDYNISASMPFHNATRKKRIKSWNRITPLNKNFIGIVEESSLNNVILSMAFVDKDSDQYKEFINTSSRNTSLKNLFLKYSHKFSKDTNFLWEQYIAPLDLERDLSTCLYDHVASNLEKIKDDDLRNFIEDELKLNNQKSMDTNLKTTFGLIAIGGIEDSKKLIENTKKFMFENYKINFNVTLDTTPNYVLHSEQRTTSENHTIFMDKMKEDAEKFTNKIFVK